MVPKLTAITQLCWLTLFKHIACMDDNADAKRILLASPPMDWRRQRGRPHIMWLSTVQQDLRHHDLVHQSSRYGSEPPSIKDAVNAWCYAMSRVVCQKRQWWRRWKWYGHCSNYGRKCNLHPHLTHRSPIFTRFLLWDCGLAYAGVHTAPL